MKQLLKKIKKISLLIGIFYSINMWGQVLPDSIFKNSTIPCGANSDYFKSLALDIVSQRVNTTPISQFPASAIMDCGKYRVYFEDMVPANPQNGFAHPTLGAVRRNTLCAVLTYLQNTLNYNNIPANNPIRLYVSLSYSTQNPAPNTTGFYAQAGPVFNNSGNPGILNGFVYDYVSTGIDPANANMFHANLTTNFDQTYVSGFGTVIPWQNDYTATFVNCNIDLYTTLLHEMGHTLGWLSFVNYVNSIPASTVGNNIYSGLDYSIHKGTIIPTPALSKLITGPVNNPLINPAFANSSTALNSNDLWINNLSAPNNHPVYSGYLYSNWSNTYAPKSILSHLDDQMFTYSMRQRLSPGSQQRYVMGPFGVKGIIIRNFSKAELNTLIGLGYSYNPTYQTSNAAAIANHTPYSTRMASYTTFLDDDFTENVTAQGTMTNNTGSTYVVNLANDITLTDQDNNSISVLPSSLFNIRGCGNGGNNHNQLVLSGNNQVITYTPRPGFYGRAQFGFQLWDGIEKGSVVIYTIDVLKGNNVNCASGSNIVINGDFEEGTEVERAGAEEVLPYTAGEGDFHEGMVRGGSILADGQPYSYSTYNWGPFGAGILVKNSRIYCNGTTIKGIAGAGTTSFPTPGSNAPNPLPFNGAGYRYKAFQSGYNYFSLCSDVQPCHRYIIEFDYSSVQFFIPSNAQIPITIAFVNNASYPQFSTPLYSFNGTLTGTMNGAWNHANFSFNYCGSTPSGVLQLIQNTFGLFIDNLTLKEDLSPPPPLVATINPTNPSICGSGSATLTANVSGSLCNTTYNWQPGNYTTSSITVSPASTQTYTLTVNDGCRTTIANATVTVLSTLPVITSITQPIDNTCNTQNATYTVNVSGGYTGISWTISPTPGAGNNIVVSGTNTANLVVNWNNYAQQATISVNVSNPCGTTTGNVTVYPCCTLSGAYTTLTGSTNPSTPTDLSTLIGLNLTNTTVAMQGYFKIISNATWNNVKFVMAPNAKISVENGAILTLGNTHFFACNAMWDGIYVNGTSRINSQLSLFEDAKNAIVSVGGGIINVNSGDTRNIFNKCYIGIDYRANTAPQNNNIAGCVFTSRNFNVPASYTGSLSPWTNATPLPSSYLALIYSNHPQNTYTFYASANMLLPYSAWRGYIGVKTVDNKLIKVGSENTTVWMKNVFDNLFYGVNSYNSTINVTNTQFIYIQEPSGLCKNCATNCPLGTAVCAKGIPYTTVTIPPLKTNVGYVAAGSIYPNWFQSCQEGIWNTSYLSLYAFNNTFTTMDDNGIYSEFASNYTSYHNTTTAQPNIIDIENNVLNMAQKSVNLQDNRNAIVTVRSNNINQSVLASQTTTDGIISNNVLMNTGLVGTLNVQYNKIDNTQRGISLTTMGCPGTGANANYYIGGNSIKFNQWQTTVPSTLHYGIGLFNCLRVTADNDVISRTTTNTALNTAAQVALFDGIRVDNSPETWVTDCSVSKLPGGIYVNGSCANSEFWCNTLDYANDGFFFNSATIGDQVNIPVAGINNNATNNQWTNQLSSGYKLHGSVQQQIVNGTPQNIKWYYNPTGNYNVAPFLITNMSFLTSTIDPCGYLLPPPPSDGSGGTARMMAGNKGGKHKGTHNAAMPTGTMSNAKGAAPDSLAGDSTTVDEEVREELFGDVVDGAVSFNNYPEERQAWLENYAYKQLSNSPELLDMGTSTDAPFQDFVNEQQQQATGKFEEVAKAIDGDTGGVDAVQQNALIMGTTEAEIARQKVNAIYLSTWVQGIREFSAEDSSYLCFIASQNPIVYGDAVYSAIVMVGHCANSSSGNARMIEAGNSSNEIAVQPGYVYPNPNNGLMQASITLEKGQSGTLSLYSIQGQRVADYVLKEGENRFEIDQRNLDAGIYYYNANLNGTIIANNKLVIVK